LVDFLMILPTRIDRITRHVLAVSGTSQLALVLSTAGVAVAVAGWQARQALLLALSATAVGVVFAAVSPSGSSWPRRRGLSPAALAVIAIALVAGWRLDGWGLAPLHALLAIVVAVSLSLLAAIALAGARGPRRLLVVGDGRVAALVSEAVAREGRDEVVGRLDDRPGEHVVGSLDELERVVAAQSIDVVVFAYSREGDSRLAELAARCRDLDLAVAVVPRLFEQCDRDVTSQRVGSVPLLVVDSCAQATRARVVSRTFDIAAASLLLVLTAPLWLAISLAIFLDERGPLLYRARRVGLHGREFDMLKFRKMQLGAAGPRLTKADDARFSGIGRMLAHTKLDELPQLINVVRGDMALVGPRPEDPSYVALYPAEFQAITRVRPGITGLSQIKYRNEAALLVGDDFESVYRNELLPQKIELDRYYASRRCLALDLRILGWTAVAIVTGVQVRRDELTQSVRFELAARTPPEALADARTEVMPAVSSEIT
jgi:lipopolysaccharide/colanic/teichoic acid biosynthesis glycosyltransferase